MSDNPTPPVGPGNDGEAQISEIEASQIDFRAASVQLLQDWFAETPDLPAVDASMRLLLETVGVLAGVTHPPFVRAALLVVLIETYAETPSFIEVGKLKEALDGAVARHRTRNGNTTSGGIIRPGQN